MKFSLSPNSVILNLTSASRAPILDDTEDGRAKDEISDTTKRSSGVLSLVADTRDACFDGLTGHFTQLENDFNLFHGNDKNGQHATNKLKYFRNEPHWDKQKCEKVKRFRFVVCTLGLAGLAFGLMSRMILNVAIVEMVASRPTVSIANTDATVEDLLATTISSKIVSILDPDAASSDGSESLIPPENQQLTIGDHEPEADDGALRFDWSIGERNFLLGSFYIGYAPSMFFSGGITDKYGCKLPLLVCILASSIINMLTPMIAATSYGLLIGSRIVLGSLQGGLIPSIYSLFNSWLTLTETSIFIPLAKVSTAFGFLVGSMLPGVIKSMGFEWPFFFYAGGIFCAIWSVLWFLIATSKPQDNQFVEPNELERIMRKKRPPVAVSVVEMDKPEANKLNFKVEKEDSGKQQKDKKTNTDSIPWLLIISCPSVLALTLLKYSYNLGFDFLCLFQATYLKEVHHADMSMISAIPSASYLMQMFLVTFIGWAAKELVSRRALGLSVTKWRKVFQSLANFGMALGYLMLPLSGSNMWLVTGIIMLINFHWMMGTGGEAMVPYDLSARYPATIMGLAHSISVMSGITAPLFCGLVLGERTDAPERWAVLFIMIGALLIICNTVFVCVLKAKPFLPGEMQQQQQVRKKTTN